MNTCENCGNILTDEEIANEYTMCEDCHDQWQHDMKTEKLFLAAYRQDEATEEAREQNPVPRLPRYADFC